MLIKNGFEVAQPIDKVWAFLDHIPHVAAALPGAQLTEELGDNRFAGRVHIRMGPVRLSFTGTAHIKERDEAAKRIIVEAAGSDELGRGQAAMLVTATLSATRDGTRIEVTQDLRLSGAAAQYGRGLISDVSAVLMRDFAANMRARIEAIDAGLSPDRVSTTRSASGFTIALRAIRLALGRVFRRFLLPYQPNPR